VALKLNLALEVHISAALLSWRWVLLWLISDYCFGCDEERCD
jgi:hypothetical protein